MRVCKNGSKLWDTSIPWLWEEPGLLLILQGVEKQGFLRLRPLLRGEEQPRLLHLRGIEEPGLLRLRGAEEPELLRLPQGVEKQRLLRLLREIEKPGVLQGVAPRRSSKKRSSTQGTTE